MISIIRWFLSFMLLVNGLLFLRITQAFVQYIKQNPEDYADGYSRLSNSNILSCFALSGVVCLALMYFAIPM